MTSYSASKCTRLIVTDVQRAVGVLLGQQDAIEITAIRPERSDCLMYVSDGCRRHRTFDVEPRGLVWQLAELENLCYSSCESEILPAHRKMTDKAHCVACSEKLFPVDLSVAAFLVLAPAAAGARTVAAESHETG